MTAALRNRYTLIGLTSGIALSLVAAPSPAQLDVTGGGATINNADVFVPTTGAITGTPTGTDNRAVIRNGEFDAVTIETNQGNIPTSAIFRANTLPTIENGTALGGDLINATGGRVLGTLSFPSIGPQGAIFLNIPTTLNFSVTNSIPLGGAPITEFRAVDFILQETGAVVGAQGVGVVQRRTPVTLVQYGAAATDQTVLGTDVAAAAYSAERAGTTTAAAQIDLSFDSGTIFTPPGFALNPADSNQTPGIDFGQFNDGQSQITYLSIFTNVALINLPSFDDIIFEDEDGNAVDSDARGNPGNDRNVGNAGESPNGRDFGGGSRGRSDAGSDDSGDGGVVGDGSGGGSDDGGDGGVVGDGSGGGSDDGGDGGAVGDGSGGGSDGGDGGVVGDGSGGGSDDDGDVVADGGDTDGDDDDGDDDDDDGDDDDDDGGVVVHPNDGSNQFRPILPGRFIFIGIFVFNNVPSGRWVDPPSADGFEYEMTPRDIPVGVASRIFPGMTGVGQADDSVFTRISGFPINVDADDTFVVSVEGTVLGEFSPGDTLRFADYAELLGDRLVDDGVRKFTISEINPAVDSSNPVAFPLQLEFNTNTASFEMRALEASGEETQISSAAE